MKFLMIFVVLFEELFKKIGSKVNIKRNWPLIPLLSLPFLVYFFVAHYSLVAVQGIFVMSIGSIVILFLMMAMDNDFNGAMLGTVGSFIFAGFIMNSIMSTEIISEKKNVTITEKKITYEGLVEDTSCEVKNCKTKVFNIIHKRKKLFNFTQDILSVNCVEKETIQEIK